MSITRSSNTDVYNVLYVCINASFAYKDNREASVKGDEARRDETERSAPSEREHQMVRRRSQRGNMRTRVLGQPEVDDRPVERVVDERQRDSECAAIVVGRLEH